MNASFDPHRSDSIGSVATVDPTTSSDPKTSADPATNEIQANKEHSQWYIEEMDCPTEEGLIRKRLGQFDGIEQLDFQLMQRKLTVIHRVDLGAEIESALRELGFNPVSAHQARHHVPHEHEHGHDHGHVHGPTRGVDTENRHKKQLYRITAAVVFALIAELGSWWSGSHTVWFVLSLVAIFLSGLQVYKKGWIALKNRNLNINALMSIAVTGALLIGEWPEAAMVMSLFALAEWIEARSLLRARNAVEQLLSLAPDHVDVWDVPTEQWQNVLSQEVPAGSLIRVRPGERIGLDGMIETGQSDVNQAPITGESVAVAKASGDTVFAGTINGMGELQVRTQGSAQDSTLARIAQAVQNAQKGRASLERFVDRFSRIYTPIVVLLAVGIAIVPPLFGWMGWFDAIYKALVLLGIACPCALVISTPVGVVSALAGAASHGVLIKGGAYIERLRHMRFLALDKTGTLTTGRPTLSEYAVVDTLQSTDVLSIAHYLAARSDHPASTAVCQGLTPNKLGFQPLQEQSDHFEALPGRGVQSVVDGVHYKLGQLFWVLGIEQQIDNELQWIPPALREAYEKGLREGASFVFLSADDQLLAVFLLQDSIKARVADSIRDLAAERIELAVLSGDAPAAVAHVGKQLGIQRIYGGLLPEDKLTLVKQERARHTVGMVGDGINDAPALAEADIGFAMGSLGSDMAIETADIAIMNDELDQIHWVFRLSRRLHAVLVQNISAALAIKAVFLIWAIFGDAAMWMAVFADVGASLLVVANSLRLLHHK